MAKNLLIVALGALSYGMLSSFAKIAYGQGYNAGEITFAQASIGACILWTAVVFRNIKNRSFKLIGNWKLLLAGTSMGVSAYTYYLSVEYIPASLAIVLLMQMTWMSILAEWVFFKKKPSRIELSAAILDALDKIAEKHNSVPAAISLAWLSAQPNIGGPVASATSVEQLKQMLSSVSLQLDKADLELLDAASK